MPFTKGYTPHNKNKSFKTRGSFTKGRIPWNKGLKQSQKPYWLGKKRDEETKSKIGLTRKGKTAWNKGMKAKPFSKETIQKIREKRKNQILPIKNTKPERFMQSILTTNGIDFVKHKCLKITNNKYHQVDIFIEPNICIEVDGDYWHGLPNNIIRDKVIDDSLSRQGYEVIRIKEKNIINTTKTEVYNMIENINHLINRSGLI